MSDDVGLGDVNNGLDFIGVDNSGKIGVSHSGSEELISNLGRRVGFVGSIEFIQGSEGGLSVDDESSDLSSGSQ